MLFCPKPCIVYALGCAQTFAYDHSSNATYAITDSLIHPTSAGFRVEETVYFALNEGMI